MKNQFLLLKDIRFMPLFVSQFTGAFNDNLYKALLSALVAYGILNTGPLQPEVVVSMAMGLLILPFIILAPLGGDLADKFDKAIILQRIKLAELVVILLACAALLTHSIWFSMLALFALGCQAALFSPGKFSILPQHLEGHELIGANALLNTGTYLAILSGGITGSLLAFSHITWAAGILFSFAVLGYLTARLIPPAPAKPIDLTIHFRPLRELVGILKFTIDQPRRILLGMIGCSWFYFVGAMLIAQLPIYTHQVVQADTGVLAFFMVVFSLGISLGGLLNDWLLRSKIAATYVPWAAITMALFMVDLYFAGRHFTPIATEDNLRTLKGLFAETSGWRVTIDLLMVAIAGGIYVVPLKSIVQKEAPDERRARIMAASVMLDSIFILLSSVIASALLLWGFQVPDLFVLIAMGTLGIGTLMRRLNTTSQQEKA